MAKAVKAIAGAALVVGSFFLGSPLAVFAARLAGAALLGQAAAELFGPKEPPPVGLSPPNVMVRSGLEFRKSVYGEALVSGPIVYNNSAGTNNQDLYYVVALTGHEVDSFVSIWLDNDEIPVGSIDWTPGVAGADGSGTGEVQITSPSTGTEKWIGENSTPAIKIFYYEGHADQVASGKLTSAFTEWTSDHRGRQVAYFVVVMTYNEDTEKVFESGIPRNFKALVRGRKLYDPAKDSTQTGLSPAGSGTHLYATPSTWEWSDDPALCNTNYKMQFMGVDPATRIDWQAVVDASATSVELVDIPPAASPANTQKRFTCNGVVSMGTSHRSNLNAMLTAMDGRDAYFNGMWRVRASANEASSRSLTESHFVGEPDVQGSYSEKDRYNLVGGDYIDPDRNHEPAEFHSVTASEFLDRDNGKVLTNYISLPFTNTEYMAQRIGYRILEQGDNQTIVTGTLNAIGADIAPGDMIDITHEHYGWTNKLFRVMQWTKKFDGTYDIECREDFASRYVDPLVSEYTQKTTGGVVIPPSDVVPPTTNLAASADPDLPDDVDAGNIRVTWTNPAARLFERIEIWESATDQWSAAYLKATTTGQQIEFSYDISSNITRYFWTKVINYAGQESVREPDNDTTTITATTTAVVETEFPAGIKYEYSNTTTATDPTSGKLQFDSLTIGSIGNLYVNDTDFAGDAAGWILDNLANGDILTIRNELDAPDYLVVKVNGTPTDNTGWWTVPLTLVHVGTIFSDGDVLILVPEWNSQAGGDLWSDVVDADIIPDGDGTRDLGSTGTRFAETYTDALDVTNNITVGGTVDGVDIAARDHDAVTVSGTPDYITLSGQDIVRGLVNLRTDVTYPQTSEESTAGVTPVDNTYRAGDLRRYGAIGDDSTNNATAFADAFSSGHRIFGHREDIYRVGSDVTLPDNIEFDGEGCVVKFTGTARFIHNAPSADTSTTISSGATQGSVDVVVASGTGMGIGEIVQVNCTGFPALWARIKGSSGTDITLDHPLPFTYSGTVNLYNYDAGTLSDNCHFKNVEFNGSENTGAASSTGEIARIGGYQNVILENVTATGYAITTACVTIQIYICHDVRISGCRFTDNEIRDTSNFFDIQDCRKVIFTSNEIEGSGFGVNISRTSQAQAVNNSLSGRKVWERTQSVAYSIRGIKLITCGTALVSNNNVDGYETCIKIQECFRATVQGNTLRNCDFHTSNTSGQALSLSSTDHANSYGASIIGNIVESTGGIGIGVDNGATDGEGKTIISGNYLRNINTIAIYANDNNCIISDNIIDEWGVVGAFDGIHYSEGATVTGNQFHNSDDTRICMRTFLSSGFVYAFENNVAVDGNPLFASDDVIESSGTATIASGTTSITITHNLIRTPSANEIHLTPEENPTYSPGHIWVDTITASQATINCETDPGTSGLDIGWRAKLSMPFTA